MKPEEAETKSNEPGDGPVEEVKKFDFLLYYYYFSSYSLFGGGVVIYDIYLLPAKQPTRRKQAVNRQYGTLRETLLEGDNIS